MPSIVDGGKVPRAIRRLLQEAEMGYYKPEICEVEHTRVIYVGPHCPLCVALQDIKALHEKVRELDVRNIELEKQWQDG